MPFQIIRNDITKVKADAIVNTANPEPVYAAGTDAAIYLAAGAADLLKERKKIGRIRPGEAAVTPAFRLHARYIIHTVGPVWTDGAHGEFATLASCYRKSLLLARQLGCGSIAFPLISTGVYGFPKDRALEIALGQISEFLRDLDPEEDEMEVTLVVFDRRAFDLSADLVADVEQFIDEHYVETRREKEYGSSYLEETQAYAGRRRQEAFYGNYPAPGSTAGSPGVRPSLPDSETTDFWIRPEDIRQEADASESAAPEDMPLLSPHFGPPVSEDMPAPSFQAAGSRPADRLESPTPRRGRTAGKMPAAGSSPKPRSLQDVMDHVGETFQQCLLRMIDERGLTDAQVYKRANIDRKLFSKIRCNPDYTPSRRTAIALAVALELNMDEATDFLRRGGIALSPGSRFDLIIAYCIQNRIYDTLTINAILFDYKQPLLGA